jgi:membrane protease YdiL (CAAX protease family)
MSSKLQPAIKDVGIIGFLVLFPHLVPLPFYSYAVVCFLLILFLLYKDGKRLRDIGLKRKGPVLKYLLTGLISAIVWVGFMQWIYIPLIRHFFAVPDYTEYDFIKNNIPKLAMALVAAWVIGGFYEEVVFRGYINALLEKRLPGARTFPWSIIITSLLFGAYHWQQDIFGVIAATLGGLYWALLYRKFNDNLWIPIYSHAFFDSLTLILIYLGIFGQ